MEWVMWFIAEYGVLLLVLYIFVAIYTYLANPGLAMIFLAVGALVYYTAIKPVVTEKKIERKMEIAKEKEKARIESIMKDKKPLICRGMLIEKPVFKKVGDNVFVKVKDGVFFDILECKQVQ